MRMKSIFDVPGGRVARSTRAAVPFALTVLLLSGGSGDVEGQDAGIERIPVVVALVESIEHPSAQAMILRELEGIPRDVILLERRTANMPRLAAAFATLVTADEVLGMEATTILRMPVDRRTGTRFFKTETRKAMHRLLKSLERSEPSELLGVGTVPNVTVWIPANPPVRVGSGSG